MRPDKPTIFYGEQAPEKGFLEGYGAIIENFDLPVALPANLLESVRKKENMKRA